MFSIGQSEITKIKHYIESHFSNAENFCYKNEDVDQSKTILVTDGLDSVQVLDMLINKNLKCVLQNSIQDLQAKIQILLRVGSNKGLFFDSSFSFIDGNIMIQKFTSLDDRESILENFFLFNNLDLEMVKNQKLYQVTQELIMNAQIDAPKFAQDQKDKVSSVIIEKNESLNLVAISVIDEYGSLSISKMLDKMYKAHSQGFRESMSEIGHGAGLGSAMLYHCVDSLSIGCIPGKKTRVTAIMPLGLSEKKIDLIQKSICIVEV